MESKLLEDGVEFGDQSFVYAIQLTAGTQLSADYKNSRVTLYMPATMVDELADTERVGFENSIGSLHLLVEKDFTCLENVAEDQSDNYPNPLALNVL